MALKVIFLDEIVVKVRIMVTISSTLQNVEVGGSCMKMEDIYLGIPVDDNLHNEKDNF